MTSDTTNHDDCPMYSCITCDKKLYLKSAFCSKECHDKYYDELVEMTE